MLGGPAYLLLLSSTSCWFSIVVGERRLPGIFPRHCVPFRGPHFPLGCTFLPLCGRDGIVTHHTTATTASIVV